MLYSYPAGPPCFAQRRIVTYLDAGTVRMAQIFRKSSRCSGMVIRVIGMKPLQNVFLELLGEFDQLICIGRAACIIVFDLVPLGAAGLEVIRLFGAMLAQNQRHHLQGPMVGQVLRRSVAFRVKQNGTELECGVVSDAETPVSGSLPRARVRQVTSHDRQLPRSPDGWSYVPATSRYPPSPLRTSSEPLTNIRGVASNEVKK